MSTEQPTAPPRRRGMSGSVRNMILSVLAVFGIALAWWTLMPGADQVQRRPVQVEPAAGFAARESEWPVYVPQDLPEGWTATSVRFEPHTDGVLSWRVGYLSPEQEFVAIDQGAEVTEGWLASLVDGGEPGGTVTVEGPEGPAEWDRYVAADQNTLVLPAEGPQEATTVVRGTADFSVLRDFIGRLQPVDEQGR